MSILFHIRPAQAVRSTRLLSSSHRAHLLSCSSPSPFTHLKSHLGHVQRRSIHILQATQDAIITLHSVTGTPWALTIPLVAVGVNLLFRLPFNVYNQRIIQRQHQVVPVLHAIATRIMQGIRRVEAPREEMQALGKKRLRKETDRVFGALGLQTWRLYSPWLGVPFWLLGAEGIRRLCGASKGLLGTLIGDGAAAPPGPDGVGGALNTSTSSSMPMLDLNDAISAAESAFSSDTMAASDMASSTAHDLATGGMLWFTDLTVPDPQLILPFAVSAIMCASIVSMDSDIYRKLVKVLSNRSMPVVSKEEDMIEPKVGKRGWLRRTMLVLCVLIGPATLHFPAAVHLYWLTSTATNMTSRLLLDIWMPATKVTLRPCKGIELPVIRPKLTSKAPAKIITGNTGEHKR